MTLTLYHCAHTRSFRVLWMLEELGLDYKLENMPFPPRAKMTDYLKINPLGTVPAFFDGPQLMTESSAAVHYLGEKYGHQYDHPPLTRQPSNPDYAAYLDWMFRSDATFTFPLSLVLRYSKFEQDENLTPVAEAYQKWFFARLRSMQAALEHHPYLLGNNFSAADICCGYALLLAEIIGLRTHFKPEITAYLNRLKSRPAYKCAVIAQSAPSIPTVLDLL